MAKKSSADKYKKLLDKVKSLDLGGGGFWRPPQGRSTIRILPPVGKMDFFFKEVGTHRLNEQTYYCPVICMDGKEDCPICELNASLYSAGDVESAKGFRAQRKFWMNIVVRSPSGEDVGPLIFTPGVMVFQTLASLISDPDYGDITDEDEGFDIKIDRTGEMLATKYQTFAARNPSPLGTDDQMDKWLEEAHDVEAMVAGNLLGYDALAEESGVSVYMQEEPDEDDEEDSASRAIERRLEARRSRRPRR